MSVCVCMCVHACMHTLLFTLPETMCEALEGDLCSQEMRRKIRTRNKNNTRMNVHEGSVTIQRLRFSELTLHSALTWRAAVWVNGHMW